MIYAEKVTDTGIKKGIFHSIAEFVPFRADGWMGIPEVNEKADAELERLANLSETSLKYLSPMMGMRLERWEQHRRHNA